MAKAMDDYLAKLRSALAGADRATIQDALSDAEEHLTTALERSLEKRPDASADDALGGIIEAYGTPEEVAAAYKEMETMTPNALSLSAPNIARPRRHGFFGVLGDFRAYAAMLYMLFSLATGIIYFTWAVTGLSLSAGLIILIIGLPLMTAFLLSVRGIAVIEGRMVEAVLGERMPRRTAFIGRDLGWWGVVKALFTDRTTWTTIAYMILQLPLGILYFTASITLVAVSLGLIVYPILNYVFGLPLVEINDHGIYPPAWAVPLTVIGGLLLFIVTLHVARGIGRLHGKYAKRLLVKTE